MINQYPKQRPLPQMNPDDNSIQSFDTEAPDGVMAGNQGLSPQVLQALKGLTQEQRDAFFADYGGQGDVLQQQYEEAEGLRNTATPEGTHTKNAGFVAANPLSHLATAVQRIRGNINASEALEAKKELSKTMAGSRITLANSLLGLGGKPEEEDEEVL